MSAAPPTSPATARVVDVTFAVLVGTGIVWALWATRHYFFWVDDWGVLRQGRTLGGIVDEYNGALSIVSLSAYRLLTTVFGFEYTPLRVLGIACLFAIPVAYYLTTRRRLGPLPAAAVSLCLLSAAGATFVPPEMNHALVLVGGIVCGALLVRGPRADVWLAVVLAGCFAAAGGAVAVAAACFVHSLCVRAPLRRWLAVGAPVALWLAWWFVVGRDYESDTDVTVGRALRFTGRLVVESFTSLAVGIPVLGAILLVAFVAYGLTGLRGGLAHRATWLAWVAAIVVWGVGVAVNRGVLADPHTFRYQLMVIGCAALAVVPRQPPRLDGALAALQRPAVAGLVVVAVFAVQAQHLVRDARDPMSLVERSATLNRGRVVVLSQQPIVVPDDLRLPLDMGELTARQAREVLRQQGALDPSAGDAALVEHGVVEAITVRFRSDGDCDPLTEPFTQPSYEPRVRIWSTDATSPIAIRRFGEEWVPLRTAEPDEVVWLVLPTLESDVPYEVQAPGACRLG